MTKILEWEKPVAGRVSFLKKFFESKSAPTTAISPTTVSTSPASNKASFLSKGKEPAAPAVPAVEQNWYKKAFSFPWTGHSAEMDELTKNHWEYRRDSPIMWEYKYEPIPLFGRPSHGHLVPRSDYKPADYNTTSYFVYSLIGLCFIFAFLGRFLSKYKTSKLKKLEALEQEKKARKLDIEKATCKYMYGRVYE